VALAEPAVRGAREALMQGVVQRASQASESARNAKAPHLARKRALPSPRKRGEGKKAPGPPSTPPQPNPFLLNAFALIFGVSPARVAMVINGRRNKPFGPGGSTRRLHLCGLVPETDMPHRRGRNRIDEGVKDVLLPEMVPT
jgi:hypothetical protein